MRRWLILGMEVIIAFALMAASYRWIPAPYDIAMIVGITVISAIFFGFQLPGHLGTMFIEFMYGLNSRGLGPNYDFERVDRQYQTLWFAILTVWYLVLFGALLGLAAGGQYWREHGSLQGLSSGAILAFWACAALWAHFLVFYFPQSLKATYERWLHRREMAEVDQLAAVYEAEHDAREDARAEAQAAERRDPFYRETGGQ